MAGISVRSLMVFLVKTGLLTGLATAFPAAAFQMVPMPLPSFSQAARPSPEARSASTVFPMQIQILTGNRSRSYLGIGVREIDKERAQELKLKESAGVEVTTVDKDSPSEKAGLKSGDVVLEYNGQQVVGTEQFIRLVRETPAGREAKLGIHRDGTRQTLVVTIGTRSVPGIRDFTVPDSGSIDRQLRERDRQLRDAERQLRDAGREMEGLEELRMLSIPDIPRPFMSWRSSLLGVEAESIDSQLASYFGVEKGVLVRSVMQNSAAAKAGFKAGDVILRVGDEQVTAPREVSNAIRSLREKQTFPVTVMRNRKQVNLSVTLAATPSGGEARGRGVVF